MMPDVNSQQYYTQSTPYKNQYPKRLMLQDTPNQNNTSELLKPDFVSLYEPIPREIHIDSSYLNQFNGRFKFQVNPGFYSEADYTQEGTNGLNGIVGVEMRDSFNQRSYPINLPFNQLDQMSDAVFDELSAQFKPLESEVIDMTGHNLDSFASVSDFSELLNYVPALVHTKCFSNYVSSLLGNKLSADDSNGINT